MGVRGQFLKKRKLCLQNLTKEWKQPPVVILQQANFCNIFILCLQIRIIRRSDQGVQFMNFPSQIFFNDINHGYRAAILKKNSQWLPPFQMVVANYFYYEKVRRTMRTAVVLNLLNTKKLLKKQLLTQDTLKAIMSHNMHDGKYLQTSKKKVQ